MKRRDFIIFGLLLLTTPIHINSPSSWEIIKSTIEHLFPKSSKFSGANELEVVNFLKIITNDKYFEKEDLDFLLTGAKEIYQKSNNFLTLLPNQKESILRDFENAEIGKKWLSMVMNYSIEGMLSDPIYGGNKNELGWIALNHKAGLPRPKSKYAI